MTPEESGTIDARPISPEEEEVCNEYEFEQLIRSQIKMSKDNLENIAYLNNRLNYITMKKKISAYLRGFTDEVEKEAERYKIFNDDVPAHLFQHDGNFVIEGNEVRH